jgi:membrane dipeptidase
MPTTPTIFDGHNDLLFQISLGKTTVEQVVTGGASTHIDLPRAQQGGFGGGMFAIFVPGDLDGPAMFAAMAQPEFDLPLPEPLAWDVGARGTLRQVAILGALQRAGAMKICTTVDAIEAVLAEPTGPMAAVMHIEGAEAIAKDLDMLHVLFAAGLRSVGPVWSRNNIFAEGVPFRFPGGPDIGSGLSDAGKRLVVECNQLGVVIDLSHLNEAGFNDVARLSDAPLIATHSNAHALCNTPRNLTERQLAVVRDSGGVVGLNFAAGFLRADGQMATDFGLDVMLRHLDHMIEHLGEDGVAIGSDFDGATVSDAITDCTGLPVLRSAMVAHGYDAALMEKLCHGNWMRVLRATWKDG